MKVVSTTDGKYVGEEIKDDIKVGDSIHFDDVEIPIQFIYRLETGNIRLGSPNYQLELEE